MSMDDALLTYLKTYIDEHGYSPSMREIAVDNGFAGPSGARQALRRLERAGLVRLTPGVSRSIVIVGSSTGARSTT